MTDNSWPAVLARHRTAGARMLGVGLFALLLLQASAWPDDSAIHEVLETLGYGFIVACIVGRTWCSVYIGGRKRRELVISGPYSVVRNPLYVFSFIGVVGIGLAAGVVTLAALLALAFIAYYSMVVRHEETVLAASFGMAYQRYVQRVPRWIPDFSRWRDDPIANLDARVVRITMRDSAWFFAAIPAFEALEWLHAHGVVPILIRFP